MSPATIKMIKLFLGTFVSAFLLIFGGGTVALMVVPVLASKMMDSPAPLQLPLSPDAEEKVPDPEPVPARQMFPPLLDVSDATGGDYIRIPVIGVNVPLVMSSSLEDRDVLNTLVKGAALYPNGVEPGRLGNAFIAAHSTGEPWKGKYRFAFLKINELKPGHVINLDYKGTRYTYRVVRSDIVKPTADFRVVSDRPLPTVTLMACWPLWSTSQRMLVTAELTNITKLTPTPA